MAFLFVLGALGAASGCSSLGATACTEEARYSVTIAVVDAQGAAVPDAVVVYSIDGGPEQTASCITGPDGQSCDQWSAGIEEAGTFVITASLPGGPTGTATATVGEDECHVISESVTITIQ